MQHFSYPYYLEEPPPYIIESKGKLVRNNYFFDADHAHYLETSHSITGLLVLSTNTQIQWYNKRHNNLETLPYVSELLAVIISTELNMVIFYKLRFLGVTIDGLSKTLWENESVVKSFSIPYIITKKNKNYIVYHRLR